MAFSLTIHGTTSVVLFYHRSGSSQNSIKPSLLTSMASSSSSSSSPSSAGRYWTVAQKSGSDTSHCSNLGTFATFLHGSPSWLHLRKLIASCWTSCKASLNQRFQCCLIVSSYFYRQPSNTDLIQNSSSGLHVTFFVTTTNHHANHPSVDHQQDKNFPMFPCYKKEISSKTVECFMLMSYSPSRCASSWLHAIITSPVIRPMAPAFMFQPETSIT